MEDDQGGGWFSAMSQSARQQQDHEHDNNNSSEATRPISISVIPRADTGRADECEDDENDYEYPKKVHGDSYDKARPSAELFGVWTHAVAFREMRIAQILAFIQKAKRVLSSNGVLHTLINRKCG